MPQSTKPAAWSFQSRTPEQELVHKMSSGYSIPCSRPNPMAWGWACQSAVRSLRVMEDDYRLLKTNPKEPSLSLCSTLMPKGLPEFERPHSSHVTSTRNFADFKSVSRLFQNYPAATSVGATKTLNTTHSSQTSFVRG